MAWDELPDRGVAVLAGERIALHGLDGAELVATERAALIDELSKAEARSELHVTPFDELVIADADLAEAPPGCEEAAGGGGVRVALCDGATTVVRVHPDGTTTPVLGPLREELRWASALPSPDGRWLLLEWTGGCQVPSTYVAAADGSGLREVAGGVEAHALGWAPDGRALVRLRPAVCGEGAAQPGVHRLDPVTGDLELLLEIEGEAGTLLWRRIPNAGEAEVVAQRAIAELGLDGCCGEPSHGGDTATTGVVWEGQQVHIGARAAAGQSLPDPSTSPEGTTLLGGPAWAGDRNGEPFVAVRCGRWVWSFTPWPFGPLADAGVLRAVAEAVVPHLYCTLREP